jgi:hypothetical protein
LAYVASRDGRKAGTTSGMLTHIKTHHQHWNEEAEQLVTNMTNDQVRLELKSRMAIQKFRIGTPISSCVSSSNAKSATEIIILEFGLRPKLVTDLKRNMSFKAWWIHSKHDWLEDEELSNIFSKFDSNKVDDFLTSILLLNDAPSDTSTGFTILIHEFKTASDIKELDQTNPVVAFKADNGGLIVFHRKCVEPSPDVIAKWIFEEIEGENLSLSEEDIIPKEVEKCPKPKDTKIYQINKILQTNYGIVFLMESLGI